MWRPRERRDQSLSFESLAATTAEVLELTLTGRGEPALIEAAAASNFSLRGHIIMAIKLSPDTTRQLHVSIRRYVAEHLEQDIGDLKAGMLLDYCLKEIGPVIYNRAIADAQSYLQGRVADLEGVCYEKEFTYWVTTPADRGAKEQKKGK